MNTSYLSVAIFIFFISSLSGCDNSLDAFQENRAAYSVYGYLNVNADTNFVRVHDLDVPLLPDSTRMLNATVSLTNTATGQTQVLQDSVIRFDSVYTHNFFTTMDIKFETPYRLNIDGPDGKNMSVSTVTPNNAKTSIQVNTVRYLIKWFPVDPKSRITYSISKTPFNLENKNNKEGSCYFTDPSGVVHIKPGFCQVITLGNVNFKQLIIPKEVLDLLKISSKFYVAYNHYAPDTFEPVETKDSLAVPGGSGDFGAFYKDTLLMQ